MKIKRKLVSLAGTHFVRIFPVVLELLLGGLEKLLNCGARKIEVG